MSEEILLNEYKYEVLKGISVSGSRAAIAQVSHIMNMYKKQAAENAELKKRWEDLERWVKQSKINFTGGDRFWAGYDDYHGDVRAKMKELAPNKQER